MENFVIENDFILFNKFFDQISEDNVELIKKYKKVIFGFSFNFNPHAIDIINNLPEGITFLKLIGFNNSIDNLPCSLKELELCSSFNRPLDFLPYGLTNLTIGQKRWPTSCYQYGFNNMPATLTHLTLYGVPYLGNLPRSVTHLSLEYCRVPICKKNGDTLLSEGITHLVLSFNLINVKIGKLPSSLTHLSFSNSKNLCGFFIRVGDLPRGLILLNLCDNFSQDLISKRNWRRILPNSLKFLVFGKCFNKEISTTNGVNLLPQGLTHLEFGSEFNKPLTKENMPVGITFLKLGVKFSHIITKDCIPSLRYLVLEKGFSGVIESIPDSLERLKIGEKIYSGVGMINKLEELKRNLHK